MRRVIPLVALLLAITACGGDEDSSAADETSTPPETTATEAPTTTAAPTATAAPTTTAPEDTTTTGGTTGDSPFDVGEATPPAVFDSFVSTMVVTLGFDDQAMELSSDGAWTGDAFACNMSMGLGGLTLAQSVVVTTDTIWFDDGTGFEEAAMNATTESVISSCGASPSFWDDFVNPGVDISGDTEQYAGRTAVKVDLQEIIELGGGFGMVPEVQDATINVMDMWIDQETNVVLGLYAEIAMDPENLDLGLPGGEGADTVVMTMELELGRINDPTVSVEIPEG